MLNINLTINWWQFALFSPLLMLWGFLFYAALIQSWRGMVWFVWIPCIPPIMLFGLLDMTFNIFIGSVLFVELPFINGITFSQRLCHWFEQGGTGWRYEQAKWWASILNEISAGHIS